VPKQSNGEWKIFSINDARKNGYLYEKQTIQFVLHTININSIWMTNLNIKARTAKFRRKM